MRECSNTLDRRRLSNRHNNVIRSLFKHGLKLLPFVDKLNKIGRKGSPAAGDGISNNSFTFQKRSYELFDKIVQKSSRSIKPDHSFFRRKTIKRRIDVPFPFPFHMK